MTNKQKLFVLVVLMGLLILNPTPNQSTATAATSTTSVGAQTITSTTTTPTSSAPSKVVLSDSVMNNAAELNTHTGSSQPVKWDGTVIWNGVRFDRTYDNTTENCNLGRVNTQYGIFQSYILKSGVKISYLMANILGRRPETVHFA